MDLASYIRNIPDFPKPGIQFKDITPVLADARLFNGAIALLTEPFEPGEVDAVVGIDARGYRDRLDQLPACLNILDFKDAVRARLMLFNDVSHYVDQPPYSHERLSEWFDANELSFENRD